MNPRENYLRAAEFKYPEWIPCNISFDPLLWRNYREKLEEVVLNHPSIFGKYEKGNIDFDNFGFRRKGSIITDDWGCVWRFLIDGYQGQVIKNPLDSWDKLKTYEPPDPINLDILPTEGAPRGYANFTEARRRIEEAKKRGELAIGGCSHGFMFQRLYYLRGFKNLMIDFITEPPELQKLVDIVFKYNMKIVKRWLEIGVDVLYFGDDLGTQDRLALTPKAFRKYILPAYSKLFGTAREKNTHVYFHSDGHVMEIAKDIVAAGVSILNIQDSVNGLDNIKKLKGKVCIDIDIDRQNILPFGKPKDVKKHIEKVISSLNSPEGGLMIQVYPCWPTPLENIETLCQALEEAGAGIKYNRISIKW